MPFTDGGEGGPRKPSLIVIGGVEYIVGYNTLGVSDQYVTIKSNGWQLQRQMVDNITININEPSNLLVVLVNSFPGGPKSLMTTFFLQSKPLLELSTWSNFDL